MKKIKRIFCSLLVLFFVNGAQAQILKKLKRAVEDKVERKAVEKVSDKAAEEISKPMDRTLNPESMAMGYGKNKVDPSVIPDSYTFSWKYSMEIQTDKGKAMVTEYFLEPNADYFGFNINSNDMFMIMDHKNKIMITTFNQKVKMASASKMVDYTELAKNETENTKFTYKTLPNKTILGYNCKGMEATNNNYVMVFYYTNDAKVSFANMFQSQQNHKLPDAFKDFFKKGEKPLTMSMEMKNLKNGQLTTMKCVDLEKNARAFVKSEYKFM
ncbi:DUF4412 domain-containing protein [Flavobacterium sp. GT3R68]|uniref:DUF4412 domain-containing protein n=1 Tax=Flavobacterium sp. GT3R68 TaxID=2594437 RepID=UPI000F8634DD|nr:DUF4412 domain-containing protein [Flavobacterium sp. GT3R68]RTY93957.1 DUF4412 domain-containing protein [Flavobacterium sp. GSN2]TRW93429.1 DUF4412 domain-containing protein [Flavobacterium sp. GT3R68]